MMKFKKLKNPFLLEGLIKVNYFMKKEDIVPMIDLKKRLKFLLKIYNRITSKRKRY